MPSSTLCTYSCSWLLHMKMSRLDKREVRTSSDLIFPTHACLTAPPDSLAMQASDPCLESLCDARGEVRSTAPLAWGCVMGQDLEGMRQDLQRTWSLEGRVDREAKEGLWRRRSGQRSGPWAVRMVGSCWVHLACIFLPPGDHTVTRRQTCLLVLGFFQHVPLQFSENLEEEGTVGCADETEEANALLWAQGSQGTLDCRWTGCGKRLEWWADGGEWAPGETVWRDAHLAMPALCRRSPAWAPRLPHTGPCSWPATLPSLLRAGPPWILEDVFQSRRLQVSSEGVHAHCKHGQVHGELGRQPIPNSFLAIAVPSPKHPKGIMFQKNAEEFVGMADSWAPRLSY